MIKDLTGSPDLFFIVGYIVTMHCDSFIVVVIQVKCTCTNVLRSCLWGYQFNWQSPLFYFIIKALEPNAKLLGPLWYDDSILISDSQVLDLQSAHFQFSIDFHKDNLLQKRELLTRSKYFQFVEESCYIGWRGKPLTIKIFCFWLHCSF